MVGRSRGLAGRWRDGQGWAHHAGAAEDEGGSRKRVLADRQVSVLGRDRQSQPQTPGWEEGARGVRVPGRARTIWSGLAGVVVGCHRLRNPGRGHGPVGRVAGRGLRRAVPKTARCRVCRRAPGGARSGDRVGWHPVRPGEGGGGISRPEGLGVFMPRLATDLRRAAVATANSCPSGPPGPCKQAPERTAAPMARRRVICSRPLPASYLSSWNWWNLEDALVPRLLLRSPYTLHADTLPVPAYRGVG